MAVSADSLLQLVVVVCEDVHARTAFAQNPQRGGPLHAICAICNEVVLAEPASAAALSKARSPDLVIIHERLSSARPLAVLGQVRAAAPLTPVIILSSEPSVELAVQAIRQGAIDYVQEPLVGDRLERVLAALQLGRSTGLWPVPEEHRRDACATMKDRFFCRACPPGIPIVGHSEGIVSCLEVIRTIADSGCNPVLMLGETGTGKELAARAMHVLRSGTNEQFIAINCAALSANLLESELFGHVRGAFTGADHDKTGLFELAGNGSILLDEISEMPVDLQAKLLRVLQEQTFRKVGGTKDIQSRCTVIASSNRELFREASAGRFRRDLYYRLAVFPVTLPPLRASGRRGDIPLLAQYFIEKSGIASHKGIGGISPQAQEMLREHDWPGNVRELKNVIDRALILETADQILPKSILIERHEELGSTGVPPVSGSAEATGETPVLPFSLETAEREFIVRALRETGWQRTRAAALLGISRATLHAKLKSYDIKVPS